MTPLLAIPPRVTSAAALAVAVGFSATGDIITTYEGPSSHSVKITGMPDLDQRRAYFDQGTPGYFGDDILGLPGNGSMYCAPTAVMNLFIYAANHGFPGLAPGPGTWSEPTQYNFATMNLALLGQLMGTDATDGTKGGVVDGMVDWIEASGDAGDFLILSMRRDGADYPLASEMAALVRLGGIAAFCYGRYTPAVTVDGAPFAERGGGHCVTFTEYRRNGGSQEIAYRDPATDKQFQTWQSGWAQQWQQVKDIQVWSDIPGLGVKTPASAINYPSEDGLIRLIDSVYVLMPRFGLSFTNEPTQAKVSTRVTFPISWPADPASSSEIELSTAGQMIDWAPKPFEPKAWGLIATIAGEPATLHELDLLSGQSLPLPLAPQGLTHVVAGRSGDLFATDGAMLFRLDADGSVLAQIAMPGLAALVYDDAADQVLALSIQSHTIFRVGHLLDAPPAPMPVPMLIPMAGKGDLVADPKDQGRVWFITEAHDSIFGLKLNGPAVDLDVIELPAVQSPTALEIDERGRLYALCGGFVVAMARDAGGGWDIDPTAVMHGQQLGEGFCLGRSRSNGDPSTFDDPEWRNVDDDLLMNMPEIADCVGDLNFDGLVDGADLGVMLGLWGANGPADVDGSGAVDGTDLGVLLSSWGACPK